MSHPITVATLDRIRAHHPQGGKLKESHPYTPVVAAAPLADQIGHGGGIAKAGAALLAKLIAELQARCTHLEESLRLAQQRLNTLESAARNVAPPHLKNLEKRS